MARSHAARGKPLGKLMTGNPHDSDGWATGVCPCCSGPLDTVKRDLAIVGRMLSTPLPPEIATCLAEELAAVKMKGRTMFAALPTPAGMKACEAFTRSVENFGCGVDRLRAVLPAAALAGEAGARPIALRFAFRMLARHSQDYARALAELHPRPSVGG